MHLFINLKEKIHLFARICWLLRSINLEFIHALVHCYLPTNLFAFIVGMLNEIWKVKFELIFLSFYLRNLHKNYQMSDKINSHICLMLSVYETFHQMFISGRQRNHILQDLTGFDI